MDPEFRNQTLTVENSQLKQDLLVAAEAGQNLLEKNKELKEKCFDHQIIKTELEKAQQENYRLQQKLRLQHLSKTEEVEQSKEQIQTLVRQHTQEKIKVKQDKEKMRTEKHELIQELKWERSKSDMIRGRGIKPRKSGKALGRGPNVRNKNGLIGTNLPPIGAKGVGSNNSKNSAAGTSGTNNNNNKTGNKKKIVSPSALDKNTGASGVTVGGLSEVAENATFKSSSENTRNIEALLNMTSVVDENFKDRTFELEKEKNRMQISKLETENRQLRRKIGELTEEITGYKMYVDMADKELEEKNAEISALHDEKNLAMEQHNHNGGAHQKSTSLQDFGVESGIDDSTLNDTGFSLADELSQMNNVSNFSSEDSLKVKENAPSRIKSMQVHNKNSEIKDQLDVALGILMEIFQINNLEIPDEGKDAKIGGGNGSEEKVADDDQKASAEGDEKSAGAMEDVTAPPVNENTTSGTAEALTSSPSKTVRDPFEAHDHQHSLIALLLILKEVSFISKSSSQLENLKSLNMDDFNDKAEITTLKETLTRLKTELEMSQEQLVDMIKQKLKFQMDSEAWQEDMEVMVAENIKLCHVISKSQERPPVRSDSEQRLRLGVWLREKINSIKNTNLSL